MGFFFMTGTTVEDFGQGGAATRDRDWLNILVKTPASWSADPSAPVAPEAVGSHSFPWVQCPRRAPHLVLFHNVGWWVGVV